MLEEKSPSVSPVKAAMTVILIYYSLVFVAMFCATYFWPDLEPAAVDGVVERWPPNGAPGIATRWMSWDAVHYLAISQKGYSAHGMRSAFFPLWPSLISLLGLFSAES